MITLIQQMNKMAIKIYTCEQLFDDLNSTDEFKNNLLMEINNYKIILNDQPGSIRYNLDGIVNTFFINIFYIQPISFFLKNFFNTSLIYIRYVRFRNPILNEGEQEFHIDWDEKSRIKRLEFFFLLDEMNFDNGCIEVMNDNNVTSISTPACSVLLIDSTILHRGTKNTSGKQRRIVSCQLAAELMSNEPYLKEINLK
jgi:hypothetical protein